MDAGKEPGADHLAAAIFRMYIIAQHRSRYGSGRRPSEAPADVLADADVELGANYPAPIVSMQESFHCLQAASKAVHLHADWPQEARKVPYRPAPFPPSGHPSHRTQNPRDPAQQ